MSKLISTIKNNYIPYKLDDNWVWYKWGDLVESYQQGLIRSNSELNKEDGIDYFKMNCINEDGSYTFDNLPKTFATEDEIRKFKINSGDFFINVRNSKELVGKSCVIYEIGRDILFNHMLVRIKHKDYVSGSFINAYLNTPVGKKLLDTCKKGTTTVIALYQSDIYELPIPIPSKYFLESIDNFYNNINKKIEVNNRINAELEQMAKTLHDYWFVQFDFPNEDGKPYKSSGGKMVNNEVLKREIPEGWQNGVLGALANLNPTLSIKKNVVAPYIEMASIPTSGYMTDKPEQKEFSGGMKFQNGDIVIARITPCLENGKTALITLLEDDAVGFGSTEFINIRAKKRDYTSFLAITSRMPSFRSYAISKMIGTSGRKRVDAKEVSNFQLPIPSEDLLQRFGNIVDVYFEKMTLNTKQNQQLSSLRDWLVPMLMNGQVSFQKTYSGTETELPKFEMAAEPVAEYERL